MTPFPLTDERTVVVFSHKAENTLHSDCEGSEQKDILGHLRDICEQEYTPETRRHEQIAGIDIYDPTGEIRLWGKAVTYIPSENAECHVLYIYDIDQGHEYNPNNFHSAKSEIKQVVQRLEDMSSVTEVEDFLDDRDAMDADDFADMLT